MTYASNISKFDHTTDRQTYKQNNLSQVAFYTMFIMSISNEWCLKQKGITLYSMIINKKWVI